MINQYSISLYYELDRFINLITFYRDWKVVKIGEIEVRNELLKKGDKYNYRFMDYDEILKYSKNPINNISRTFIEHVKSQKYECFAAFENNKLVSYAWFSCMPVHIFAEYYIDFDKQYKLNFKNFTHPDYRGKRLLYNVIIRAWSHYYKEGFIGLLTFIRINNISSFRAHYRIGYKDIGRLFAIKILSRFLFLSNSGCKRYSFKIIKMKKNG